MLVANSSCALDISHKFFVHVTLLLTYFLNLQTLLKLPGFSDDVFTHILSGLGAGFFAVCIGSPVDVVRNLVSQYLFFLASTYGSICLVIVGTITNILLAVASNNELII